MLIQRKASSFHPTLLKQFLFLYNYFFIIITCSGWTFSLLLLSVQNRYHTLRRRTTNRERNVHSSSSPIPSIKLSVGSILQASPQKSTPTQFETGCQNKTGSRFQNQHPRNLKPDVKTKPEVEFKINTTQFETGCQN